ncbi:MAG: hypothetical protein M1820_004573 [Bogoriella megaspora]|nr:MAG: hypothetical protein M1820_004573 [Bogoriella megaspora]
MAYEAMNPPIAAANSFANRTVLVTGSAGKLGRVICRGFAEAGANVVVNDINAYGVSEIVTQLTAAGHSAYGIICSASTSAAQIVAQTIKKYGRIDAVVNPTLGPIPWKPLEELSDDDFRTVFEANVLGPISITKAAWPHFQAQKFGRVVNFTSDSMLGFPTASAYTLTKGALFGVNKTLAMEGAPHNIKVNCVSPIAYAASMEPHITRFSSDIQNAFRTIYTPDANVPTIMALCSENCEITGEVFNTAGWAAGRNVWGYKAGVNGLKTMEQALEKLKAITEKTDEVFEPSSMIELSEWQSKYVL